MSLNVKFAVSTWLWTSPFTTETVSLFPKIKSMGYDAVEIPVEYPEKISGKKVKEALNDNGLSGIVCGAFGPSRDLTHDDPAVHEVVLITSVNALISVTNGMQNFWRDQCTPLWEKRGWFLRNRENWSGIAQ